jgi:hypothetical protein
MTKQQSSWFKPVEVVKGQPFELTIKDEVAAPSRDMTPSSAGDDMRQLEYALVKLGYLERKFADGVWDQVTEHALKKFQADWHLGADGLYGPGSRGALTKALAGQKPAAAGGGTPPKEVGPPADLEDDPDPKWKPLDYVGGSEVMGSVTDVSGTVYWVKPRAAKPETWPAIKAADLDHWWARNKAGEVVTKYEWCADLPHGKYSMDQYGPNCEFFVGGVGIGSQCGGYVDIYFAAQKSTVKMLHFWTLSSDLKRAQEAKTPLPAGTYLGSTSRHIGFTSGPHCHLQNQQRTHRDTWIDWMHGK